MNTNIWKKIGYVICGSIGLSLSWYVFYSLLYKFGFEQTGPKIYNILCENGDEDKAIQRAREKYHQIRKEYSQPSKMIGCTTVYKLVEELKKKIDGE